MQEAPIIGASKAATERKVPIPWSMVFVQTKSF
jgi:hypothetical protein